MQKRKSHNKSRNGCTNCKLRHVKCDEQGPPCANCVSRKITDCTYSTSRRTSPTATAAISSSSSTTTVTVANSPSNPTSVSPLLPPSNPLSAKPPFFDSPPALSTLLQLELMHRWSTHTYKSLISVPPDASYMQIAIPRGGLQHEFILRGIMAVSALDIAASSTHTDPAQSALYFRRAMELYDLGSAAFRSQLSQVTRENIEWVFVYSSVVSVINMALLPSQMRSALDVATTMFDLTCGTAILAYKHMDWLLSTPYGTSISYASAAYSSLDPSSDSASSSLLPRDIQHALQRLSALVPLFDQIGIFDPSPLKVFTSPTQMYALSIQQLERCFVEEQRGELQAFCTAFPAMVGPDFTDACKKREPMALIILLHWTILMDRLGRTVWWAGDLARALAGEIAELLREDEGVLAGAETFREAVEWVMWWFETGEEDGIVVEDGEWVGDVDVDVSQMAGWEDGMYEGFGNMAGNG